MLDIERFVAVISGEEEVAKQDKKPIGLTFYPCTFEPNLPGTDGVILKFAPGGHSKVQRIAEGWKFTDMIMRGEGWLLTHGVNGEVALRKVNATDILEPITYGDGTIAAYIAGRSGLEVFGMNCPPFEDGVTELDILEVDSIGQSLNPKFWQVYHTLVG